MTIRTAATENSRPAIVKATASRIEVQNSHPWKFCEPSVPDHSFLKTADS
jgi:hypothetical protein